MHQFFHVEGKTDLAVMRSQATARLKADNKWGSQTESILHVHRAGASCRGQVHEFFPLGDDQDLSKRFWEAITETEEMETVR